MFAQSIFAKREGLRDPELSCEEQERRAESITGDLRRFGDLAILRVRRRAREVAITMGIDLFKATWHDQREFDCGRAVFQLEHFAPVGKLKAACLAARPIEEVDRVLAEDVVVVWVLKEEDKKLTALGYKCNRNDPAEAYRRAGIEVVESPIGSRFGSGGHVSRPG